MRQRKQSAAKLVIEFRTLAAKTGWLTNALQGVFFTSSNNLMKDQLASRDEPSSFEDLVSNYIHIDNRLRERSLERNYKSRQPVPYQVGRDGHPLPPRLPGYFCPATLFRQF